MGIDGEEIEEKKDIVGNIPTSKNAKGRPRKSSGKDANKIVAGSSKVKKQKKSQNLEMKEEDDVKLEIEDLSNVKRVNRNKPSSLTTNAGISTNSSVGSIFEPMVSIAIGSSTTKSAKQVKSVKFKDTPLLTLKTPNKRERIREIQDQKLEKR